jgi:glutaredoxin
MTDNPALIVYCRTWCGDCARARRWLDENNIPYTEIDVDADDEARERAAAHNEGRLHTPTFECGDGAVVDFRPDDVEQLLKEQKG